MRLRRFLLAALPILAFPLISCVQFSMRLGEDSRQSAHREPTEVKLIAGLLQRSDLPGDGWTITEWNIEELAEATRRASASGSGAWQPVPAHIAACFRRQSEMMRPSTVAVARQFERPEGGGAPSLSFVSVMSSVQQSAEAGILVSAVKENSGDDIESCAGRQIASDSGGRFELLELTSLSELPTGAVGYEIVVRVRPDGRGPTGRQHLALIWLVRGDYLAIAQITAYTPDDTTPAFLLSPTELATKAARRLNASIR